MKNFWHCMLIAVAAAPASAEIDFSPATGPIGDYFAARPDLPGGGLMIVDF